jgi:hypothetical protein
VTSALRAYLGDVVEAACQLVGQAEAEPDQVLLELASVRGPMMTDVTPGRPRTAASAIPVHPVASSPSCTTAFGARSG